MDSRAAALNGSPTAIKPDLSKYASSPCPVFGFIIPKLFGPVIGFPSSGSRLALVG
jgi:hypothetical protein